MSRTTPSQHPLRPTPSDAELKIYNPAPVPVSDRDVLIQIHEPGWYRLRMWADRDFVRIPEGKVPPGVRTKKGVRYVFDDVPPIG